MSAHLERLKAEEAELEAQMLGDQASDLDDPADHQDEEISTTGEEGLVATEEEAEAASVIEEIIVQPDDAGDVSQVEDEEYQEVSSSDDEQLDDQPQKPQRTDWKKRFVGLQKTHEATVHAHKREVMDLNARVADLESELFDLRMATREVQGDVFDGVFSQEDEDTLGSEGLDIVKKAAKAGLEKQLKPLQEELRRQEKARLEDNKRRAQTEKSQSYQQFLERLESLVPEYAELNVDKGFLSWMSQPDEFSGQPRGSLFRKAEANGDVLRVADFFMQYKEGQKPKQKPIPKEVERHVTPVGSGGGGSSKPKKKETIYYRESDINKFYNDVLKGRYDGKQSVINATEQAIELAYTQGRILRGQ